MILKVLTIFIQFLCNLVYLVLLLFFLGFNPPTEKTLETAHLHLLHLNLKNKIVNTLIQLNGIINNKGKNSQQSNIKVVDKKIVELH